MLLTWRLKLCRFNIIITLKMPSDWLTESRFNVILACQILCKEMNTLLLIFLLLSLLHVDHIQYFAVFWCKFSLIMSENLKIVGIPKSKQNTCVWQFTLPKPMWQVMFWLQWKFLNMAINLKNALPSYGTHDIV